MKNIKHTKMYALLHMIGGGAGGERLLCKGCFCEATFSQTFIKSRTSLALRANNTAKANYKHDRS